jgi:hypothetical protein
MPKHAAEWHATTSYKQADGTRKHTYQVIYRHLDAEQLRFITGLCQSYGFPSHHQKTLDGHTDFEVEVERTTHADDVLTHKQMVHLLDDLTMVPLYLATAQLARIMAPGQQKG